MLIAPGIDLPDAALTQHIAILGKTGSGKTYTAKSIVEQLLALDRRVIVIDPTGAWWGLRSSSDGKGEGFPVVILGGQHGDASLPSHSGAACAELVTQHALQVVFDTSSMSVGERTRWFTDFAGGLFRLNRTPVHVILDEAHMFAPQSGGGKIDAETGKMLHAANTLASGGRSRGVRLMMITQRPAKLHKDSLTCCDTLIAMKVIAPQDRDAIGEWIDGCGDQKKGKEVLGSLAQLARGEGWVWYPEGDLLTRAKFPKIRTFDSSATPEDGHAHRSPERLSSIDLSAVTATLAAAVEEAKGNDVGELKKRVKQLEQDLAAARKLPAGVMQPADIEKQIEAAVSRATLDLCDSARQEAASLRNTIDAMELSLSNIKQRHGALIAIASRGTSTTQVTHAVAEAKARVAEFKFNQGGDAPDRVLKSDPPKLPRSSSVQPSVNGTDRGGGTATSATPTGGAAQRILDALEWWRACTHAKPTRVQTAFVAGYSPRSSGYEKQLSILRNQGLISFPDNGLVSLTDAGRKAAKRLTEETTSAVLWSRVLGQLGESSAGARVLVAVRDHKHPEISRADLAQASNYSDRSSGFEKTLSTLRGLDLITFPRAGYVTLSSWLEA